MRLARVKKTDRPATHSVAIVVPPAMPAAVGLEERFRTFYERMHDRALDFAERFGSRVEAEDAVHDAMLDLWRKWLERGPEPFADHFFLAIVRHKMIDQRRASHRMVSLADAEAQLDALAFRTHASPTRGEARGDVLDLAIAALPPKRREAFVLAHEQEYTYKEVCTALRVSEGTVRTHLRLAMADIRATFEAAGYVPAPPRPARLRAPSPSDQQPDTGAPDDV